MATSTPGNEQFDSTSYLRNQVEQSVALLCECQDSGSGQAGPAQRSSLPIHIDSAYLQKGALVDAAKALAALWKVPSRAKAPGRAMEYSR